MDDTRLIGEAQAGDRTAFENLVQRHDRSVLRLALRVLGSEEEAKDAYQETFLRLYRTLGDFRHECSVATWILRIASNVCMDRLRRRAARREEPASVIEFEGGPRSRIEESPDERPDHDPERVLARHEIRRRLEDALGDLAPRERLVFEMRHYEGLRLRQIGEMIGTTEDTVKNCLFRAHHHLREALADLGGIAMKRLGAGGDAARAGIRGTT